MHYIHEFLLNSLLLKDKSCNCKLLNLVVSHYKKERTIFTIVLMPLLLQVVIVKLKMDKDRKAILERKARGRQNYADKGKHTEESIMETS